MYNICSHLCVVIDVLAEVSAGVIIDTLVDVLDIDVRADVVIGLAIVPVVVVEFAGLVFNALSKVSEIVSSAVIISRDNCF